MALAGGDFFFYGGLDEKLKGMTVLRAVSRMNFDAITLGELDFAHGSAPLLESMRGLPVGTTNMAWADDGRAIGKPMLLREYRGMPVSGQRGRTFKVAVLAFMDEKMQAIMDGSLLGEPRKVKILPAIESARTWVPRARRSADLVVALVHLPSAAAAELAAKIPGIDLVISGHGIEEIVNPPRRLPSGEVLVANGDRGRFVGEVRYNFGADGKPLGPVGAQIPLDASVPADTSYNELIARYKAALAAGQRAAARGGRRP